MVVVMKFWGRRVNSLFSLPSGAQRCVRKREFTRLPPMLPMGLIASSLSLSGDDFSN